MNKNLFYFLTPLAIMFAYIMYHYYKYSQKEFLVNFPIESFDPRDPVRGQYLNFRIIYSKSEFLCKEENKVECGCIEVIEDKNSEKVGWISELKQCEQIQCQPFLKFVCKNGVWTIPHSKFYLSESLAKLIMEIPKDSYIQLNIQKNGDSHIHQLFVKNPYTEKLQPLEEYLQNLNIK